MKLFISWSKETSHAVALALRDWLPMAVPSVEPWVSSEDIAKGTRGRDAIVKELQGTGQGVICLTRQNVKEPWLNFEAGALSNHSAEPRVRTVLFDLKPSDVVGPLSDFQHTDLNDRDDVLKLVRSINETAEQHLSERQLTTYFDKFWGDLVTELGKIREAKSTLPVGDDGAPPRRSDQVLEEVLERVRAIERSQRDLVMAYHTMDERYLRSMHYLMGPPPPSFVGSFVVDAEHGVGEILSEGPTDFTIRFGRIKQTVRMPQDMFPSNKIFKTLAEAQKYRVRNKAGAPISDLESRMEAVIDEGGDSSGDSAEDK
ncbi:hypothetical protein EB73_38805 [Mycobacterium sp. SWH-M3]|nr:hypothetical protein EB73_38805 [Mycobacterium sp. SWH-M3]